MIGPGGMVGYASEPDAIWSKMPPAATIMAATFSLAAVDGDLARFISVSFQPGSAEARYRASSSFGTWSVRELGVAERVVLHEFVATRSGLGIATTFEEYELPGLKTENGVATLETERGTTKAAWFKDSEGNILSVATG
jgi:hypothetical protein